MRRPCCKLIVPQQAKAFNKKIKKISRKMLQIAFLLSVHYIGTEKEDVN